MFGNKKHDEKRFILKSSEQIGIIALYTVVDIETGVNYLITLSGQGLSTIPLRDKNGEIIVDKNN